MRECIFTMAAAPGASNAFHFLSKHIPNSICSTFNLPFWPFVSPKVAGTRQCKYVITAMPTWPKLLSLFVAVICLAEEIGTDKVRHNCSTQCTLENLFCLEFDCQTGSTVQICWPNFRQPNNSQMSKQFSNCKKTFHLPEKGKHSSPVITGSCSAWKSFSGFRKQDTLAPRRQRLIALATNQHIFVLPESVEFMATSADSSALWRP